MFGFINRRKRWIIGATALGAASYAGYKLWQRQQEIVLIYREVSKALRASNSRLKAHYDETQGSCDQAVLAHLATLRSRLAALADVEAMHARIRTESDRAAKLALWEELKLASIARTLTAVYALVLSHLLMRVATNLVARHLMLEHAATRAQDGWATAEAGDEVVDAGEPRPGTPASGPALPVSLQLRLLSAADHLVKGPGLTRLLATVQASVAASCASLPDAEVVDYARLERLLAGARKPIELGAEAYVRLVDCLLPPRPAESSGLPSAAGAAGASVGGQSRAAEEPEDGGAPSMGRSSTSLSPECAEAAWMDSQLEAELHATVRSAPFAVLLQQSFDQAFAELARDLARRSGLLPDSPAGSLPDSPGLPVAKLIPRIANCVSSVLDAPVGAGRDAGHANGYLTAARRASSLAEFCFMVYAPAPAGHGLGDDS